METSREEFLKKYAKVLKEIQKVGDQVFRVASKLDQQAMEVLEHLDDLIVKVKSSLKLCSAYKCYGEGTVESEGEWYCEEHAEKFRGR